MRRPAASKRVKKRPEFLSDALIALMRELGVEQIAFNPGASFRAIHDSIVNFGGNVDPEIVLCCNENVSVYIAQGYARAKGKPMAVITHDVVGLLNATNAIYHAWCSRVPVLIIGGTGPMDAARRRPRIDWIHTALIQGNVVRDYVKWDDQPTGVESAIESLIRGFNLATTEPCGPVYLCFDIDLQETRLPQLFSLPNVKHFPNPRPYQAEEESLRRVARMLIESHHPVIIADSFGRRPSAVGALVSLAELLSIPVVDLGARFNFPNTNPLDITDAREAALRGADLVLALDVEDVHGAIYEGGHDGGAAGRPLIGRSTMLIQIGLALPSRGWSQDLYRLQPSDLQIIADTEGALVRLVSICRTELHKASGARDRLRSRFEEVAKVHGDLKKRAWERARSSWNDRPISTARLAAEVWNAIKEEDWVLVGGNLNGWARRLWDWSRPYQYLGKSGAGSAGYGFSSALGAALAYKETEKLCVDLQPDGDLLYFSSAVWTAAYSRIPMLVVMFNNRSYYNDVVHQENVAKARGRPTQNKFVGMKIEPPVDFAGLARSMCAAGFGPVEDPGDLKEVIGQALKVVKEERRLAIVDVLTACR